MNNILSREDNPMFFKLFDLKYGVGALGLNNNAVLGWSDYEIYAKTTREVEVYTKSKSHICPIGTKVRVWMVSRFGDVGITDNLVNPIGYDARGLDADIDLIDYEFILKKQ